jgi:peptidoglycan/xylan/chitin deacetylase (PgdA/CDA1 family)
MKVPVFMYHEVNSKNIFPELTKFVNKKYILEVDSFEAQLEYIRSRDYTVLTVSELNKPQAADREGAVVMTFDDGYMGNYLHAFKLLRKFNFKATFFITTDWVGLPNMLNWKLIKEMNEGGMEIGSHTCSHLLLAGAKKKRIEDELRVSKEILEEKIKEPVVSISYPQGSFNTLVNSIAYESGYTRACVSRLGYWKKESSAFAIPRITATDNFARFKKIMEQDRCFYLKEKTVERAKKMTRAIFGEKIYNKLYFKLFNLEEIKK